MGIEFRKETGEFHLFNKDISYIICILENGHIGNLYYGPRVSEEVSYQYLRENELRENGNRPHTSYVYDNDCFLSLQHTRQEYACYGTTDFSLPAFEMEQIDGSRLSHFVYRDHRMLSGKPRLEGLPHTYTNHDEEAETLEIDLVDVNSETLLTLSYSIFKDFAAFSRSARFQHLGEKPVRLTKALSFSLDLPDKEYEWLHLDGAWGRERYLKHSPLHQGSQAIYSLKGASSAEHNPFIALKRFTANEQQGEVLGFSLVYSGNFLAQVDVTSFGQSRITMGIHPERFSWLLEKGQSFQTPEVVMVYSSTGLSGMSQVYHKLYQKHLMRGKWRDKERPVLLNNWEAMEFDFDEERLVKLAEQAAAVGAELFVLDDGWFGQRNHDRAGLGDWQVNRDKLPSGLTGLIKKVKSMGLKFGLWIEPEMVNKDSNLYREHPDWILHHPKHSQSHGRHQFTLDLSREDVYQNIHHQLYTLLANHEIDYIKWDMNRYMTEVFSSALPSEQQGEIFHRYILNLYRLYDSLITAFPHVLFESCSSGGGRFDPGMLYYAPQTWTSDDTDAIERLKIQYGTSIVYPLISMGCHVSATPNQQVGRETSLETRGNVAFFGSFGYELDLLQSSSEELEEITQQIAFYKEHRRTFQFGQFTRLLSPFEGEETAWQVISEDQKEVIIGYYRRLITVNAGFTRLRLQGLAPDKRYRFKGQVYYGNQLMYAGLPIRFECFADQQKDFSSELFILECLDV
ncbi:alpha-galactosidase [Streptococcus cuniculi]|uniref:Alpha-galactosidase n=1 Tax=Streptococcus cuniculi TaxID=1432788 RepID=A0A1Q8E9M8_9STRE|nr:alpha-galactosidase [Streptococcus cuniculi]OLF48497.1 alpha-galactosidase [Streptococcus cuniculi]